MSNNNKTLIGILTDRSGSMRNIQDDVIGGFNTFLEEQKNQPGECLMTYAQFDDQYDEVFQNVDIQQVKPLTKETFIPRGMTALLDAWGRFMGTLQESIVNMDKEDRPDNVVVVVITDGLENKSKEFKRPQIFDMIADRKAEGWSFTFLAANQDAVAEASHYGIAADQALSFGANPAGVNASYAAVSRSVIGSRRGKSIKFSQAERSLSMGDLQEPQVGSPPDDSDKN